MRTLLASMLMLATPVLGQSSLKPIIDCGTLVGGGTVRFPNAEKGVVYVITITCPYSEKGTP